MNNLEKVLSIGKDYKIINYIEREENKRVIKIIYIESKKYKDKCPICNEYTRSIHDKLRIKIFKDI